MSESRFRIVTDLHVPQSPWWDREVTVSPWSRSKSWRMVLSDAWALLRLARRHDAVITSKIRNALAVGLYKRLTGSRIRHVVTEMRLDNARPGLFWKLKVALQRFAFRRIDVLCVSARQEIDAYADRLGLPRDRFRFVPWHTNVLQPAMTSRPDGHVFAAGRTGRDWPTFAKALDGCAIEAIVVCDSAGARRANFPANVTVKTDIEYAEYAELLRGARLVVVPLESHVYSSGQVVFLEAMSLGKPVIVTRTVGSEDYIEDGVTGLYVTCGSAEELRGAIDRVLGNPALERDLGRNALEIVLKQHTLEHYLRTIVDLATVDRPAPGKQP